MSTHSFKILNASAGAGKTFALVKEYLLLILSSDKPTIFQHILALTFTNKAVAEMKGRILEMLWAMAFEPDSEAAMCEALLNELPFDKKQLQHKSALLLRKIFKEYGRFDIITLDRLTYSIVRTFSKDLKLPHHFEVVLEKDELLLKMLQNLFDEIGTNAQLTQTLLGFSQFKISQQQSWDIEKELYDMAQSLLKENDRFAVEELQKLDDPTWINLKSHFQANLSKIENEIVSDAKHILQKIKEKNLTPDDFYKKVLYTHFEHLENKHFEGRFNNQLELALKGEKPLYKKTTSSAIVNEIEELRPLLLEFYLLTRISVGRWLLCRSILKQWTPMSLLREMGKRLNTLQFEQQKMLLGQFNNRISKIVQDLPAPFIYERLGARYHHYFIDEFQDTSVLQWENLIPLIGNALEGETSTGQNGTLFLVGDPKQAIYRWRGGNNQQFLNLLNKQIPFQIEPLIETLETNYRSYDKLIHFNNDFFKSVLEVLTSSTLKNLFKTSTHQKTNSKKGGLVTLSFISQNLKKEEENQVYSLRTIQRIEESIDVGFEHRDIAILVRTGEQAKTIGKILLQNSMPFQSEETLYLSEAANVCFLIQLLRLVSNPNEKQLKKELLDYVWQYGPKINEDYHSFVAPLLDLAPRPFFEFLNTVCKSSFQFKIFKNLSLYESILYSLSHFPFLEKDDSFMLFFLEYVFEFTKTHGGNRTQFLDHWTQVEDTVKVNEPEEKNAIRIMTIHKAKGLEFPVVILPFLDKDLYGVSAFPIWYNLKEISFNKLPWAWVSFSKKIKEFGANGQLFYERQRQAQEADAINVLYVALTRAKQCLHIITKNTNSERKTYALLFKNYVLSSGNEVHDDSFFSWGSISKQEGSKADQMVKIPFEINTNLNWKQKLIVTQHHRENKVNKAIARGILLHQLMEKVDQATPQKIIDSYDEGELSKKEREHYLALMNQIIAHPQLKTYFNTTNSIYCEIEILAPQKPILRPDRVVIKNDHAAIIDYKSGIPKREDKIQMEAYEDRLKSMGISTVRKFLIYTQKGLEVEELK